MALGCWGCDDPGTPAGDAGADLARGSFRCCRLEGSEDCTACMQKIGVCCYQDKTIGGAQPLLTRVCLQSSSCKACCNECARLSCDKLKQFQSCPNDHLK
jgi:hypothetical protein